MGLLNLCSLFIDKLGSRSNVIFQFQGQSQFHSPSQSLTWTWSLQLKLQCHHPPRKLFVQKMKHKQLDSLLQEVCISYTSNMLYSSPWFGTVLHNTVLYCTFKNPSTDVIETKIANQLILLQKSEISTSSSLASSLYSGFLHLSSLV